jgi:hypothetical protein
MMGRLLVKQFQKYAHSIKQGWSLSYAEWRSRLAPSVTAPSVTARANDASVGKGKYGEKAHVGKGKCGKRSMWEKR